MKEGRGAEKGNWKKKQFKLYDTLENLPFTKGKRNLNYKVNTASYWK